MSSPQRSIAERLVDSEIRHRSRFMSDNNADFYQMKLVRLEQDFLLVQDQLNMARVRLRTAEDFEIKYQLLTKHNGSLLSQNGHLVKELGIRTLENQQLMVRLEGLARENVQIQKLVTIRDLQTKDLMDRIIGYQIQVENQAVRASAMHDGEIHTLKKANHELQGVIQQCQSSANIKATQLSSQISKLKQHIKFLEEQARRNARKHEEQMGKTNEHYQAQLNGLEERLFAEKDKYIQFHKTSKEKQQLERKDRQQGGGESGYLKKQIETLGQQLNEKSLQLQEVFDQKNYNLDNWGKERNDLRQHIELLQKKLYQRQRENELELVNCKERLTKLHAEEISSFKQNQQQLIAALNQLRPDDLLKDKDNQIIMLKDKVQNDHNMHERDRDQILKGIDTLKERIRQHNSQAQSQHKIQTSLNFSIQQERTVNQTDYQNNVTFLDQQLKRAMLTIEQKNLEIKKLLNEIADLKGETEDERRDLITRAEAERRHLNQQIDRLMTQRQQKDDELKKKQKELKVRGRQLEQATANAAAERKAYERLQQQLHNDCKRMAEELKMTERFVREERQKNVTSVTDMNSLRRQKVGDLDRQREEIQLLYRGKMDQLRDALNLQIDKLRVQRDKLVSELTECRLELVESQQNFAKVSGMVAQESKLNKEKLVQYHKKMTTLNMEINLTQNLYNSFMDAKSRLKQSRSQKEN